MLPLNKYILMPSKIKLLLWISLLLISCGQNKTWHTATLLYFDTLCEIKLCCDQENFTSSIKEIDSLFSHIENIFSPDSSLFDSQEIFDLFKIARKIYLDSTGDFDISIAPLTYLWGFHNPPYKHPAHEEILMTLESVGLNKIEIREKKLFLLPGMSLDWGGIAKGFGVDLASKICKNNYISRGFINAGGDLFCWGNNPQGHLWKVGIKHPREEGFLGILSISETGAATTGDYQRYFIQDGIRYHHVLNPKTGYPAKSKQSVTVVGPETVICDALSTAVFVSSEPEKIMLKHKDYSAIIIDSSGKISFLGKKIDLTEIHRSLKQKHENN